MPAGATYIYNVNFFAGFLVASGTYCLLCRFSPIPATSTVWMEVGDEIENPTLAYGARFDEDEDGDCGSGSGEDVYEDVEGAKEDAEVGIRERRIAGDHVTEANF